MPLPPRPDRPRAPGAGWPPAVIEAEAEPPKPEPTEAETEPGSGDTEPSPPPPRWPPEEPTLESLSRQVAALAAGLQVVIRRSDPPSSPPRSSIRVAADASGKATRVGLAVLGGVTLLAEFVAERWPHAEGPLRTLGRVLLRLLEAGVGP